MSRWRGVNISQEVACVAGAWKQWAQEKTGAGEGDTRAPVLSFAHYFQAPARQATQEAAVTMRRFNRPFARDDV